MRASFRRTARRSRRPRPTARSVGWRAPPTLGGGHCPFFTEIDRASCAWAPRGPSPRPVLWRTAGDCYNYDVFKGHGNAVLDLDWSWDGSIVFSASTDKYGAAWDAATGARLKKLRGHSSVVNSIAASQRGPHLACTASDDTTVRVSGRLAPRRAVHPHRPGR